METRLKQWLKEQSELLCTLTLKRTPNMLPDEVNIAEFLQIVAENLEVGRGKQLTAVQFWALTCIGHDAPIARDWLTILRVLKDEMFNTILEHFTPQETLTAWRLFDDILTYALIEASQLASDVQRSALLEHTISIRQQLERLEQAKTSFIAVAAHELKTPLTILEGYTNMLRIETEADSYLRTYVDGMESGMLRMNEIISDMIDVSLIDANTFDINFQRFYLEKVILIVADKLDRYFAERNIDLTILPLGVELRIYGDAEKLSKALNKVIMNALKFTPDGGHVIVKSQLVRQNEATEAIDGYVDIQVTDTGIGINREHLEIIFDKFTSAMDASLHSSSKTKFKGGGPGLGLPIAKGIVEAHGGRIWAESTGWNEKSYPGSTFHIELPILLKKPTQPPQEWAL